MDAFSLEPVFLGDYGAVLQDIVDNKPVFEQKKPAAQKLRETIARIHSERGPDISSLTIDNVTDPESEVDSDDGEEEEEGEDQAPHLRSGEPMPYEDLVKMRDDISFNIHQASVQLAQLQEVANLLLNPTSDPSPFSQQPTPVPPPPELPPITLAPLHTAPFDHKPSIQATNTRIALGIKDRLVLDASSILSRASASIASRVESNESTWAQAVRARREHWNLIPIRDAAPRGSAIGTRREDSMIPRNFLISYALEGSPAQFRPKSRASFSSEQPKNAEDGHLVFPKYPRRRIRVTLSRHDSERPLASSFVPLSDENGGGGTSVMQRRLLRAQREVVEEEIFALLVQEAATFPSAATSVSEEFLTITVSDDTALSVHLIPAEYGSQDPSTLTPHDAETQDEDSILCNLILHILSLLLLRAYHARRNAGPTSTSTRTQTRKIDELAYNAPPASRDASNSTPILSPLIQLLQYRTFLTSIHADLSRLAEEVRKAGLGCDVVWTPVLESGDQVVRMLSSSSHFNSSGDEEEIRLSGEGILSIDSSLIIRLTFSSPTTLVLHLPHTSGTLGITSLGIMRNFLMDEVRMYVLGKIFDEGNRRGGGGARWTLDRLGMACVGIWDERGIVLRFTVEIDAHTLIMTCIAFSTFIDKTTGASAADSQRYSGGRVLLDSSSELEEPGSGKKTTMLAWSREHTRSILERAR